MTKIYKYLFAILSSILIYSCNSDTNVNIGEKTDEKDILHYIFLGHIRGYNFKVDSRIEKLDLNTFDRIWLGGDITSESSRDYSYLEYIDSLFDVSNPSNAWAFGNHDLRNFNVEWLEKITGKKTYSAHNENKITTIVLNLFIGPDDCERLNDQFYMIKNVCDTIQESSHLIVISHQNVWKDVPTLRSPYKYSHVGQRSWIANCFDKPAEFIDVIYPLLLEVKSRNIGVVCVMGDTGLGNLKGQIKVSDDGIYFISSGINKKWDIKKNDDRILIFEHIPDEEKLSWDFHNLDSLVKSIR